MARFAARFFLPTILLISFAAASWRPAVSGGEVPQSNTFSLSNGASVSVSPLWAERRGVEVPPPEILQTSSPRIQFSEILALENRESHAVLKLALSNNPFKGRSSSDLLTRMQAPDALANTLFYFFSPQSCLTQALVRYRQEVSRKEAAQVREEMAKDSKERDPSLKPPDVRVDHACRFSPALADFYAEQVAAGVVYRRTNNVERVTGMLRPFSLRPVEEFEMNGLTVFLFEVQGENYIDRSEIERYGLPESLRGTRPHFFYAIAAPAPFPFLDDPLRKEVAIIHVAYATLSLSGDARPEFLALLRTLRRN